MTRIDTSKLICPPRSDASQREWHLYRRFREEQSIAYRLREELNSTIRISRWRNVVLWIVSIALIGDEILIRTISDDAVDEAVAAILEWMI